MRLVIVSAFPEVAHSVSGGVAAVTSALVDKFSLMDDMDVQVVSPTWQPTGYSETRGRFTVTWLPCGSPGVLHYWTSFRRSLHRKLRTLGPDIVHFQGISGWALGYGGRAILTIHGIPERDAAYGGTLQRLVQAPLIGLVERAGRMTRIPKIVISPYVLQQLGSTLRGQLHSIENPVEDVFFTVVRRPAPATFLYVGRISSRKNILELIRGFAELVALEPSASLRLAGKPDSDVYMEACRALVRVLGLEGQVQWLGNLSRDELLTEFSLATGLVLYSRQETAPMVVAEAMAAGVPVVATAVGGTPFLIADQLTGLLVDPLDRSSLVGALRSILIPHLRETLSIAARAEAMKRFSISSVAAATRAAYNDAICSPSTE